MIKSIHIRNFKSLKDISMTPSNLNLLMGLNGMGKSSFIQSMLLLRQNTDSGLGKIALNGLLTEIGNGRDALYQDAVDEVIGFDFEMESDDVSDTFSCRLKYHAESNVLDNNAKWQVEQMMRYPLFNNDFQYLTS